VLTACCSRGTVRTATTSATTHPSTVHPPTKLMTNTKMMSGIIVRSRAASAPGTLRSEQSGLAHQSKHAFAANEEPVLAPETCGHLAVASPAKGERSITFRISSRSSSSAMSMRGPRLAGMPPSAPRA
jgi:hypothetical protein